MTPAKMHQLSKFQKCAVLSRVCLCLSHSLSLRSARHTRSTSRWDDLQRIPCAREKLECSHIPGVHFGLFHNILKFFMFLGLRKRSEFYSLLLVNIHMKFPYHLEVPYTFSTNQNRKQTMCVQPIKGQKIDYRKNKNWGERWKML